MASASDAQRTKILATTDSMKMTRSTNARGTCSMDFILVPTSPSCPLFCRHRRRRRRRVHPRRLPRQESPLAVLLAPGGEEAEDELVLANLDVRLAGHQGDLVGREREVALLVVDRNVLRFTADDRVGERSLGVDAAG